MSPSPSRQPVGAAAPSTSTAALQQRAEAALQAMGGAAGSSGTSTSLSNFQKDLDAVLVPEGGEGDDERTPVQKFLFPDEEELPDNLSLPVWDHLEELRERVAVAGGACVVAIASCFAFSKDLILFLEAPVADAGVRFLQLSPGEFFFTTLKVSWGGRGEGVGRLAQGVLGADGTLGRLPLARPHPTDGGVRGAAHRRAHGAVRDHRVRGARPHARRAAVPGAHHFWLLHPLLHGVSLGARSLFAVHHSGTAAAALTARHYRHLLWAVCAASCFRTRS